MSMTTQPHVTEREVKRGLGKETLLEDGLPEPACQHTPPTIPICPGGLARVLAGLPTLHTTLKR